MTKVDNANTASLGHVENWSFGEDQNVAGAVGIHDTFVLIFDVVSEVGEEVGMERTSFSDVL